MDIGVFIPINNNGWLLSATSPQYMPEFRVEPACGGEGGGVRDGFCAFDDQVAWVWGED